VTDAIIITLGGAPRGKGRPRFSTASGRPRAITPSATRAYEAQLKFAASQAMGRRLPLSGAVKCEMTATVPIPQSWSKKKKAAALAGLLRPTTKPDWDNYAKTCDALNQIVWVDDAQVVDGRVVKFYGEQPMLVVTVTPMAGELL
jgi:Holliday junction resolvase RusA-like endonuclease